MKYLLLLIIVFSTSNLFGAKSVYASGMAIKVIPLYDSKGPKVNVGKYSRSLKSKNLKAVLKTARLMEQEIDKLTPAEMYVLSIRLFDLGAKDDAVIWFYRAHYRSQLFFKTLLYPGQMYGTEPNAAGKLWASYISFKKQLSTHITGYAGCNIENWVAIIRKVEQSSRNIPDLPAIFKNVEFIDKSEWINANIEVSAEMQRLWQVISSRKNKLKQMRTDKNMDTKYCNSNAS